jgi:hypothetical protein
VSVARRQRKISHSLFTELVPDSTQIVRLVELHLICHGARAELLVGCVLQVPASLVLLHIFANHCASTVLGFFSHSPPDLQVLHSIAVFVFCGALPCDNVRAEGRETELEDVGGGKRRDDMARRGVNNRNPADRSVRMVQALIVEDRLTVRVTPRRNTCCRARSSSIEDYLQACFKSAADHMGIYDAPYFWKPGRGS